MSEKNPVKILNTEVARKIAAGEVIDRPNSIIRELMDNSIDAEAKNITVEICGGGIEKIRIIDDGCGMTKQDLQNSAHPHATSKISTEVDLLNLHTLGFRGEALSSIAAVSRLSVISGGWKMRASITEDHITQPAATVNGTIVQTEGLFENFPARRQFLKRPATEALMCKNTFIEKTLAYPKIGFRFIQDGETKIDLPPNQSLKERFIYANGYAQSQEFFYEISNSSLGKEFFQKEQNSFLQKNQQENQDDKNCEWSFTVIIGEPAISRQNKKEIFIYTNGRRIQEYSLVQAVEYGCTGFFPNGTYPVAGVFIQIRPDLIDFNIHPAKKEARFFDISTLHHGLSSTIKDFFKKYTFANFSENKPTDEIRTPEFSDFIQPESNFEFEIKEKSHSYSDSASDAKKTPQKNLYSSIHYKMSEISSNKLSDFRSKWLGIKNTQSENHNAQNLTRTQIYDIAQQALDEQNQVNQDSNLCKNENIPQIKFIGCCLGTFLLAEKSNCLYIIDQHAAHERILFDKIMNSQGENSTQNLLIPYKIHTESKTQDLQLEKLKDRLKQIGFSIEKINDGFWEVSSIPERWTGSEYDLRQYLFVKQVEPEEIIRSVAAMTACKAAVKDGYILDDGAAESLVKQAFLLDDPHCPHGRPVYTVISREKLFELVKRT